MTQGEAGQTKGASGVSHARETLSLAKTVINKSLSTCLMYPPLEIFNKLTFNFLFH